MLLLDLDRFKEVNDSLGHGVGDALLCQVAGRLHELLWPHHQVARLGGDEFAVVLSGTDAKGAVQIAEAVRGGLAEPVVVDGQRLHIDTSIGVATAVSPSVGRTELLRWADLAMYDAKNRQAGVAVWAGDADVTSDRLRRTEELRSALTGEDGTHSGRLVVHLQPQVALIPGKGAGRVVGAEALVRWDHPVHGLLGPAEFLPLAQTAGLLGRLADVVIDEALSWCSVWWAAGRRIPVSVNVTATDLHDATITGRIAAALTRQSLPGEALVVELTEETLMVDPVSARVILDSLRRQGIGVSIDDFGTGFSSLAYLHKLAVDELKLDRVFIKDLDEGASSLPIVRVALDLAHSLGLRAVAEGIESEATLRMLADLGCDIGQGFGICRPMPAEQMVAWLAENDPIPAVAGRLAP